MLQEALSHPIWKAHEIGKTYSMKNVNGNTEHGWKIAYYPILRDGKTNEAYDEPRVLIEKPIKDGIDFREVPIRYLIKE